MLSNIILRSNLKLIKNDKKILNRQGVNSYGKN